MFPSGPDQRLWIAQQRRRELIYEADQNRLARAARRDHPGGHSPTRLLKATYAGLGRAFAAVRGLLPSNEPCNQPCPGQAGTQA
jgi:hypothetical protein